MNIGFNLKLQMASAGLAVALVTGACAIMAPKADYVPPPLGATWVRAQRDSGSFGSGNVQLQFRRGERMCQGQQVIAFETPQWAILAESTTGSFLGIVSGNKPVMTWDPAMGFDFPLEIGKTWTKNYRLTIHAKNQTIPFQQTQKVEAYEDVTVMAGTFKAFKVTSSNTLGNEDVYWYSPELGIFVKQILTRTAKNAAGPGVEETEIVSQTIKK